MKARIHKILKHTKVEGPGARYCIWFQGCSRHCSGCWAKATWDFNGGKEIDAEKLLEDIKNTKNIEGVTFLGGEPFEQSEVIEYLAKEIKKTGLSLICFTGNKLEDIQKQYGNILENIDILIDGSYEKGKQDFSRPWVGSSNQKYHFLTDRYNEKILSEYKNKIEVNINKNGIIFINGMGDFEKVADSLNMPFTH
jgi:anaerobic ribonucleoside-triphosphate reductase activating protein